MFKEYHRYKIFLMIGDAVFTAVVVYLFIALRPYLPGRPVNPEDVVPNPAFFYLGVPLLWHAIFATTGVYDTNRIHSLRKQFGRLLQAHLIAVFSLAGILYFSYRDVSRLLVLYFSVAELFLLVFLRGLVSFYIRKAAVFFGGTRLLIIGSSETAEKLALAILREHSAVVTLVGFADDYKSSITLPGPLLGRFNEVPDIIAKNKIDLVMIALNGRQAQTEKLIFQLESLPVRVYLIPDMLRLALVHAQVESFGDMVAIGIREPVIQGHRRLFKRLLDVTISLTILFLTWPLLLIIWIAVRLDSPGPAIYVARRVGANGKLFNMYKFRTMVQGAEKLQDAIVTYDDQNRPIFKPKNDPRVTALGRLLRRTSLDELPQLFNVLKGDMSLVGPRPEQPFITEQYESWQWRRLSVPPGITGWWQVSGRSDLAMHLNSQYDLYYVKNYSILLDLRILFKTIGTVLRGKGAY